jgi:hypothetical protein
LKSRLNVRLVGPVSGCAERAYLPWTAMVASPTPWTRAGRRRSSDKQERASQPARTSPMAKPERPGCVRTPTPHGSEGAGGGNPIPGSRRDADIRSQAASGPEPPAHRTARRTLRSRAGQRCRQAGGSAVFRSESLHEPSRGETLHRAMGDVLVIGPDKRIRPDALGPDAAPRHPERPYGRRRKNSRN